jgi:hypothetical protein
VLGERLPSFTKEEQALLKGSADFFGLNNYTSTYAAYSTLQRQISNALNILRIQPEGLRGSKMAWSMIVNKHHYFKDIGCMIAISDAGGMTDMGILFLHSGFTLLIVDVGWPITPWGIRKLLEYIQKRYQPSGGIYLFENGIAVKEQNERDAVRDVRRINFVNDYLIEIHKVILFFCFFVFLFFCFFVFLFFCFFVFLFFCFFVFLFFCFFVFLFFFFYFFFFYFFIFLFFYFEDSLVLLIYLFFFIIIQFCIENNFE